MSTPLQAALPLVSVVIPSYNHVRYIRECIDSVLAQDYPRVEVIVVDDGSSDGSLEQLRSYGSRITLLQQKGGRQARARNLAVAVAAGEYIAFLDSDDRYLPNRIGASVQAFMKHPDIDLVWGDFRVIDADGRPGAEMRWVDDGRPFALTLIAGNPICNATVTVRRSALEQIGGFDERIPRACDGHAWYRLAALGKRFAHCGALVLEYRVHGWNDSARFALMTRERDTALVDAVIEYRRHGLIAGARQLRWLRAVLLRQFAFRAAASVQEALGTGLWAAWSAAAIRVFGSGAGLRALAWAQAGNAALRRWAAR